MSSAPPGTAEASPALTKAAEELAKELARVALAESSSNSAAVSTGRDALVELRHLHDIAETVKTNAVAAASADAAASAAILKQLHDMELRMEANAAARNLKLRTAARLQRLQWAIGNTQRGNFEYYVQEPVPDSRYRYQGYQPVSTQSGVKVESILLNAMKGCGTYVGQTNFSKSVAAKQAPYYDSKVDVEAVTAFHTALCEQIHSLTGELPVVTANNEGLFVIRFNAL